MSAIERRELQAGQVWQRTDEWAFRGQPERLVLWMRVDDLWLISIHQSRNDMEDVPYPRPYLGEGVDSMTEKHLQAKLQEWGAVLLRRLTHGAGAFNAR